jgi:hypothetical protein
MKSAFQPKSLAVLFSGTFIAERRLRGMFDAVSLMFRTHISSLVSGLAAVFALCASVSAAENLRILAPSTFREGTRIPIRIERLSPDGSIAKEFWSRRGIVVLSGNLPTAVTNDLDFKNGVAVLSMDAFGTNDLLIHAHDFMEAKDRLVKFAPPAETAFGGTLPGNSTTWSGVVRLTNDVTVPTGHTLRIEPGTLVLADGAASGTTATDIFVEGTIESFGTAADPVWITAAGNGMNWGQIRHSAGSQGVYRYTFIHKGGRTAGEGHTGTGPVLRLNGANVRLENSMVSELWTDRAIGKGMFALNSDLVLDSTIFAQMRMGPEIEGTSLLCTNSYFMEMRGPDDCDGIYLHDAGNKSLRVVDSVFIGGDDDAIDTLSSSVLVTDCIFRGWLNEGEDAKAISVFNGSVDVQRCLVADCYSGISAKAASGTRATVVIDHSTIVTKTNCVAAAWKSNAPGPNIAINIKNSIVRGNPAVSSAFGTTNVTVSYSLLSTEWAGQNVSLADPLFANADAHDYRLTGASPAIDSGDPATPKDEDGSRNDLGYLPFKGAIAIATLQARTLTLSLAGVQASRYIITERSSDLKNWTTVEVAAATSSTYTLNRPLEGAAAFSFFRFRIE